MDELLLIVQTINSYLSNYVLIVLLIGAGLFFTIRTRFVQVRCFGEGIKRLFGGFNLNGEKHKSGMSSFQAVATAIAAQVGTGNIVGACGAILIGGPGAIFWMWLIALLGGATAFTESTLAQIYKRRNPETGESYGGPAYYIEAALHSKPLAVLFALSLIATYAGGFNMLCSYNLQSTFLRLRFLQSGTHPLDHRRRRGPADRVLRHGRRQADHRLCLHPGAHHGRTVRAGGPWWSSS